MSAKKNSILSLSNGNNWFSVSRPISRQIGLNAAVALSEIITKFEYFEEQGKLEEGWFYLTVEAMAERTTLGKDAQQSAFGKLKSLGFIDIKIKGLPAKRYIKFNPKAYVAWIEEIFTVGGNPPSGSRNSENDENTLTPPPASKRISSNNMAGFPPTAPIYKETLEDNKKELRVGGGSPPSKINDPLFQKEEVSMPLKKYQGLVEQFSQKEVDYIIEEMVLYAKVHPKKFKKYEDHYAVAAQWMRRERKQQEENNQWKTKSNSQAKSWKETNGFKDKNSMSYGLGTCKVDSSEHETLEQVLQRDGLTL